MTISECNVEYELFPHSSGLYKLSFEGYSKEFISPEEISRMFYKLEYEAFVKRREAEKTPTEKTTKECRESPIYYDTELGRWCFRDDPLI